MKELLGTLVKIFGDKDVNSVSSLAYGIILVSFQNTMPTTWRNILVELSLFLLVIVEESKDEEKTLTLYIKLILNSIKFFTKIVDHVKSL